MHSPNIRFPCGTHWIRPFFCITHQVNPGPWTETVPQRGLPFPEAGKTQSAFLNMLFTCTQEPYLPPQNVECWIGRTVMIDRPSSIDQPGGWVPPPIASNMVIKLISFLTKFSDKIERYTFPGQCTNEYHSSGLVPWLIGQRDPGTHIPDMGLKTKQWQSAKEEN